MDTIQEDGRRVERLFRDAAECGITIQCRSLAIEEIQDRLLSGHWLLIALVDKRKVRALPHGSRNCFIPVALIVPPIMPNGPLRLVP
jgi:hypothetical protein